MRQLLLVACLLIAPPALAGQRGWYSGNAHQGRGAYGGYGGNYYRPTWRPVPILPIQPVPTPNYYFQYQGRNYRWGYQTNPYPIFPPTRVWGW